MGREKKTLPQAVAGGPKERHRRNPKSNYDPKAPMPVGFEAKPMLPKTKSKHHSYLEFVENTNKKKKLEFQVAADCTARLEVNSPSLGHHQGRATAGVRVRPYR